MRRRMSLASGKAAPGARGAPSHLLRGRVVRAVIVEEAAACVAAHRQRAAHGPVGLIPAAVLEQRQREVGQHVALKVHGVARLPVHDLVLEQPRLPVAARDAGPACNPSKRASSAALSPQQGRRGQGVTCSQHQFPLTQIIAIDSY